MTEYRYTACGGVLVREDQVLVLLRPSRCEVRLPKGHIEAGETSEEAALREVMEETGYPGLKITGDLGEQIVEFDYNSRHIVRTERFYFMELSDSAPGPAIQGEAQFDPVWRRFDEAMEILSFKAEREWVKRAKDHISRKEKR